jgi:ribosome modulation factor
MSFEWSLKGYIRNDNAVGAHRISHFLRLKTLVASGLSWLLFLAVPYLRDKYGTASAGLKGKVQAAAALDALYKKSHWLEGIRDKNHHARWRAACFLS